MSRRMNPHRTGSSAALLGTMLSPWLRVAICLAVSLRLHHPRPYYWASAAFVVVVPANRNSVVVGSVQRRRVSSVAKTRRTVLVPARSKTNHHDPWSFTKRYASLVEEQQQQEQPNDASPTTRKSDSDDQDSSSSSSNPAGAALKQQVLQHFHSLQQEAREFVAMFGLGAAEATLYRLFAALRRTKRPLGLQSAPFVLRHEEILAAVGEAPDDENDDGLAGYFTMKDLEQAVVDDFLDAARGSTDNRKGWQITDVSVPRGESFEEARMSYADVMAALDKGTVIFNAAGAHIPKLAGPSLACTDATALPCALNLYITAAGKRTSAPPHTDKQDVVVVQTQGRKHWKIFAPPNPALKPGADIFARGKLDDNLPLHGLMEQSALLLETTLHPGDMLFCPAGFPHTTATVVEDKDLTSPHQEETSVHMTLGMDHHIWELDYLQTRRLALRRAGVTDHVLGPAADGENPFVGRVNELPDALRRDVLAELPLGLLENDENNNNGESLVDATVAELKRIANQVDAERFRQVDADVWRDTLIRVRQQGMELLEIHRDMYLAALEEGRTREAEDAMTAHLQQRRTMSPDRIQRLSLFRVKRYYDRINNSKQQLKEWSLAGASTGAVNENVAASTVLASDWAFTLPVKVGDEVEADLGGAFFPATVTRASNGTYDVAFFDGDRETGLGRSSIKLLSPPKLSTTDNADTSKMTPKQLKRWRKEQEKLSKKGLS